MGTNPAGAKFIEVTAQDTGSGLSTIAVVTAINLTPSVPPFTTGTTAPVVVTGTKVNQSASSTLTLKVTDVAGNMTTCDPVFTLLVKDSRKPVIQTFNNIPKAESKITVVNDQPGLRSIQVIVNGRRFRIVHLADNETRRLNVSSAMIEGDNNTITLKGRGKKGGSATVVISD